MDTIVSDVATGGAGEWTSPLNICEWVITSRFIGDSSCFSGKLLDHNWRANVETKSEANQKRKILFHASYIQQIFALDLRLVFLGTCGKKLKALHFAQNCVRCLYSIRARTSGRNFAKFERFPIIITICLWHVHALHLFY